MTETHKELERLNELLAEISPGRWTYEASNENHGAYVGHEFYGDICDCYVMSQPRLASTANGGPSKPIPMQKDGCSDKDAEFIALARNTLPALLSANAGMREALERLALPLAFTIPRTATKEETARMKYAQAALDALPTGEAVTVGGDEMHPNAKAAYEKDCREKGVEPYPALSTPSPSERVEKLEREKPHWWKAKYQKANRDLRRLQEKGEPNMYWNVDSPEEPTDPSDAASELADEYGVGFYVLEMSSAWQGPDYFFVVEATEDPDNKGTFETKLTEYPSREEAAAVVSRALLSDTEGE